MELLQVLKKFPRLTVSHTYFTSCWGKIHFSSPSLQSFFSSKYSKEYWWNRRFLRLYHVIYQLSSLYFHKFLSLLLNYDNSYYSFIEFELLIVYWRVFEWRGLEMVGECWRGFSFIEKLSKQTSFINFFLCYQIMIIHTTVS